MRLFNNYKPTLILGVMFSVCCFSFSTASSNREVDSQENLSIIQKTDCSTTYTICDAANPDDYEGFDQCMIRNGCGTNQE